MAEYQSNSHKSKEMENKPVKKVEKAISGTAKKRKKSEIRKFTDVFMPDDVSNVKSYILFEVLVPKIKKMLHDFGFDALDVIFYGETGRSEPRGTASKISYQNYFDSKRDDDRDRYSTRAVRARNGYNFDDIVFDTRGEAEEVLSRMDELVATYGIVSVADMNELAGTTGEYTDNKYGWTDIRNASVVRIRNGYVIKMPKAMPLD